MTSLRWRPFSRIQVCSLSLKLVSILGLKNLDRFLWFIHELRSSNIPGFIASLHIHDIHNGKSRILRHIWLCLLAFSFTGSVIMRLFSLEILQITCTYIKTCHGPIYGTFKNCNSWKIRKNLSKFLKPSGRQFQEELQTCIRVKWPSSSLPQWCHLPYIIFSNNI